MLLFNRFLSIVSTVLVAVVFEVWQIEPTWTVYIGVATFIIVVGSFWSLSGVSFFKKQFWHFSLTALIFLVSALIFFILIDDPWVRQFFIISVAVFYSLILSSTFSFLHRTKNYQPYALENLNSYTNTISLFLFYASLYGLKIFLGWPWWISLAIALVVTVFLFGHTLWSFKIDQRRARPYLFLAGILMAEISLAISFLPSSFLFSALLLILVYYFLLHVIRDLLLNSLTYKGIRRYLLISLSIMIISFLTTRWH